MAAEHSCARRTIKHLDAMCSIPVSDYPTLFQPWLGDEPELRWSEGLFTLPRTFWVFLSQMLCADGSCQAAVARAATWILTELGEVICTSTSAYCQARARLSLSLLQKLRRHVGDSVRCDQTWQWHGRRAVVLDGSSLSMPDTAENQKQWPQPESQKPGCGFPFMRIVGLFCLATGTLIEWVQGPESVGEQTMWQTMVTALRPQDVLVSDRAFCSFANLYLLPRHAVDCVMRLNTHRECGKPKVIKPLGRNECIVEWKRSGPCPKWLDPTVWDAMPKTMLVRQVKITVGTRGFRTRTITLATTLLDPKEYPAHDLAQLFRRRWMAELYLRDLKITMRMDMLRCKTPEMIIREVEMHLLSYNLVRAMMAKASVEYPIDPTCLSFSAALQFLREWKDPFPDHMEGRGVLLFWIAHCVIPHRPDRVEPRARKRRPKGYQLLTEPRHQFREIYHRNRYSKEHRQCAA